MTQQQPRPLDDPAEGLINLGWSYTESYRLHVTDMERLARQFLGRDVSDLSADEVTLGRCLDAAIDTAARGVLSVLDELGDFDRPLNDFQLSAIVSLSQQHQGLHARWKVAVEAVHEVWKNHQRPQ